MVTENSNRIYMFCVSKQLLTLTSAELMYILSAGTELALLPLAELALRSPWLDTDEVLRPFRWSSKSCGELRLSLDRALEAKDELVEVTFA